MPESESKVGRILWQDMAVADAASVRDFYSAVVGWRSEAVDMGDHEDYSMIPADGDDAVAGICHATGPNAGLPPAWLLYIGVADLDASLARVTELGGSVILGPRDCGKDRYCVVRDPAGAAFALYTVS